MKGGQLGETRTRSSRRLRPALWPGTREGDLKSAIAAFKLVVLAYPDSADANDTLAAAYLKDGQNELVRQHAEKGLGSS
jgi:phosphoserine phosphatase